MEKVTLVAKNKAGEVVGENVVEVPTDLAEAIDTHGEEKVFACFKTSFVSNLRAALYPKAPTQRKIGKTKEVYDKLKASQKSTGLSDEQIIEISQYDPALEKKAA